MTASDHSSLLIWVLWKRKPRTVGSPLVRPFTGGGVLLEVTDLASEILWFLVADIIWIS